MSLPPPPSSASLSPRPQITSGPGVPLSTSGPLVPVIVQASALCVAAWPFAAAKRASEANIAARVRIRFVSRGPTVETSWNVLAWPRRRAGFLRSRSASGRPRTIPRGSERPRRRACSFVLDRGANRRQRALSCGGSRGSERRSRRSAVTGIRGPPGRLPAARARPEGKREAALERRVDDFRHPVVVTITVAHVSTVRRQPDGIVLGLELAPGGDVRSAFLRQGRLR